MIKAGDMVLSTYAARWTGVVLGRACDMMPDCARSPVAVLVVRMTRDRNGNPVRKPLSKRHLHVLHAAYLRKIDVTVMEKR